MTISVELVEGILLKHLKHFNTSGQDVDATTVLETALSNVQVIGQSPRAIYKTICRHDIVGNGGPDKKWPNDWVKNTCESLAPLLAN